MEQVTDNEVGDSIKRVLAQRSVDGRVDWGPVIIMMADYVSSIDQRLAKIEALVEGLNSARSNTSAGLSIG